MSYDDVISRNWGFIDSELQQKIRQSSILLAGCGLGSDIAMLATRIGFTRFTLADGDDVEHSNLNRQNYDLSHIGLNKAEATGELIKAINPEVDLNIFSHFITEADIDPLVAGADFIINMVDPGPVMYRINQVAMSQGKTVLFPMNVGFGVALFVFAPGSITLEEMTGNSSSDEEFFLQLLEKVSSFLPDYLKERYTKLKEEIYQEGRPLPQLGIAAFLNASLVVSTIVKALSGLPLKLAPEPIVIDTWTAAGTGEVL